MKVFLSWSGDLSHKVACAFRDWLPTVIQAVRPYVSSEDIDKGTRWSTDIAKELQESSFGIVSVTKDNIDAPWINFEAGALSKTIEKSNVAPFLLNIKRSEVQGPLLQFQLTVYDKEDVSKLLSSINRRLEEKERLDEQVLKRAFEVWWPHLQKTLDELLTAPEKPKSGKEEVKPKEEVKFQSAILEEILELARNQQKLLRSPSDLLPPAYFVDMLEMLDSRRGHRRSSPAIEALHRRIIDLEQSISMAKLADANPELRMAVSRVHEAIHDTIDHSRFADAKVRHGTEIKKVP